MEEILKEAAQIYMKTACAAGCCGDLDGAFEYIDGKVGEMIQELRDKKKDQRPHSRACGIKNHEHGPACSTNCPTCEGK